jgi:hypothetical protein
VRINRNRLSYFLEALQKEGPLPPPTELAEKIAGYLEEHPACLNPFLPSETPKRFSYSTVGYGIFNLLGEKYRMGRVEIFDQDSNSSYQTDEGTYCMPHEAAAQFEDFMDSLQTDLPIQIEMGRIEDCQKECARALGLSDSKDLYDAKIVEEFSKKSWDRFAQKAGYPDYETYKKSLENPQ